jgi:hypothetical protein
MCTSVYYTTWLDDIKISGSDGNYATFPLSLASDTITLR